MTGPLTRPGHRPRRPARDPRHNRRPGVVGPEVITARHRNIALLVAGCYFMEMLDGTATTRQPTKQAEPALPERC